MTVQGRRIFEFGPYRLDAAECVLERAGKPVRLTPKAFETLRILVEAAGRLVEREELVRQVWPDTFVEDGGLTRNISALRKALGGKSDAFIETVPKRGYRFVAPVRAVPDAPSAPPAAETRQVAIVACRIATRAPVWADLTRARGIEWTAECRDLIRQLAGRFGNLAHLFAGTEFLVFFAATDAGARFALKLLDLWQSGPASAGAARPPLQVACHHGECIRLEDAWMGREVEIARRVADAVPAGELGVTESALDQLDPALIQIEPLGIFPLDRSGSLRRALYRVAALGELPLDFEHPERAAAESWFLRGARLIRTARENSEEEAACYRAALRLRPEYAEAHNNLAVVLRARGDLTGAAEHYRNALRLRPGYAQAHYNYGLLLQSTGRTAGALEQLREALRQDPEHVDAHHALANTLKTKGDPDAAEEHYRRAVEIGPASAELHNNYGVLLDSRGESGRSREQYERALRLRPDYAQAHYNYALTLEDAGDRAAAEEHYRATLAAWPECAEAHNNLAALLQAREDRSGAELHYREALRLRPDAPESHYNYALLLASKGEHASAQEHFRAAAELAPDNRTFSSAIEPP